MYNQYPTKTEAWWAMQEAISLHQKMEEVSGEFESFCEELIDKVDDAEIAREDMEKERDQLQAELDKYEEDDKLVPLMKDLKKATDALSLYVNKKLKELGEDVQEGDSNSGPGTGGDGGDEGYTVEISASS